MWVLFYVLIGFCSGFCAGFIVGAPYAHAKLRRQLAARR